MSRKEKKLLDEDKEEQGISRRDFLRDAGLIVGGATIGSTALLAACGGEETTKTVTTTATTTAAAGATTVTDTVTTTVGAGQTVTETVSKFVCPIDGLEFDTLAELQAHFAAAHPEEEGLPGVVTLTVNGKNYTLKVEPDWTLAFVLRNKLLMPGTKVGCDRGECGTCTVVVDGRSAYSCMILAIEAEGKDIQTIEGLATGGRLHPVSAAFVDHDAQQCGFCTPGFVMAAKAFIDKNPNPTMVDVEKGLGGNLCRCGTYVGVRQAVLEAAKVMKGGKAHA